MAPRTRNAPGKKPLEHQTVSGRRSTDQKGDNPIAETPRLRIRMYRHGLGDCLLLRFAQSSDRTFNIVIDCGLIGVARNPKETMARVVQDISTACDKHIDVVVMTHEHWDHASGFSAQQAREIFSQITIGEVWYSWTEDPLNALGIKLRQERADKVAALAQAVRSLSELTGEEIAAERSRDLTAMLGFFGVESPEDLDEMLDAPDGGFGLAGRPKAIGKTRDAFEYLKNSKTVKTRFCYPEQPPFSLSGVKGVRVYVLGPPQDEALIKKSAPTKTGREVYEMASECNYACNLATAFSRLGADSAIQMSNSDDCPFDVIHRRIPGCNDHDSPELGELIHDTWADSEQEWRKIEYDWTQAAETLALNLDTHTNNSCLVLAFEFIDTGDVFLFPADAQIGNWMSWQNLQWEIRTSSGPSIVTGPDLLRRTVFYKVSHHGSHNATLRALGLEQMTSDDLVAFIPVVREDAQKNRWMGMPFEPLVKRLKEKTGGRLLRSDDAEPPNAEDLAKLPSRAQDTFLKAIEIGPDKLYFEYRYQ
ncbi:hypothetical protein [Noviherbaspirillum massiliense]|uniref:hypothetical protein n=1 Tax=Noviherbaspirillum massiliense TaxID=1465823 RepID=UPI0002EB7A2D|nr:hypothetical protein [Noviherbaspirillum massiliense]